MSSAIQICGTASGVGKSVLVCGLCRIFLQDGFYVSPFKAQNMSLNSFVTKEGDEIGRAQATQAESCRIAPHADMNPVLIKPATDIGAQVIVQGKPVGNKTASDYQDKAYKQKLFKKVKESFARLSKEYDIIVMEGAGSPAEINLKRHDIVNMRMAGFAKAPVVLATDIDKGGAFASLVGTLELLNKRERAMVKGFIINKFRGDKSLLKDAISFLEKKTKRPVLGIIPYFFSESGPIRGRRAICLPEEDSVALEEKAQRLKSRGSKSRPIKISVVRLPHISNFTDFDALENEPDVSLNYASEARELAGQDAIIIPGSKNTIKDLDWLKKSGMADKIATAVNHDAPAALIGICGGYQMLGKKICDTSAIESNKKQITGLGILPIETFFEKEKVLAQVKGKEVGSGLKIFGYEIHHGQSRKAKMNGPVFKITERGGRRVEDFDGAFGNKRDLWGTYIHGIFDADNFRRDFLNRIRRKKGLFALKKPACRDLDREFDKLAGLIRSNLNMKLLYKIMGQKV